MKQQSSSPDCPSRIISSVGCSAGMWWCWEIQESINKALRDQLAAVLDELHRIEAGQGVNEELLDTIQMITTIMKGMQEDIAYDR